MDLSFTADGPSIGLRAIVGRQRGEQRQRNVTTLHLGLSAGPVQPLTLELVPPAQQWQGRGGEQTQLQSKWPNS